MKTQKQKHNSKEDHATSPYYASSLEEIVFQNRNKEYGAYYLRKQYRKYVIIGLVFALLSLGAVISYPLATALSGKTIYDINEDNIIGITLISPPEEKQELLPPPPPPPEALQEKVKFTAPVIVDDTSAGEKFGIQSELADQKASEVPDDIPGSDIVIEEKPAIIEQPEETKIHTFVQEMPEFPGGEAAMYEYIAKNIHYPVEAKELGIQGKIYVTFIVETDGSISGVILLRGIGGGCDEEALRVIREMPKWKPGRQQGNAVRVSFNIPINFTLR